MKNIINFLKGKIDFPALCMLVMTLIFLAVLIWIAVLNVTSSSSAEASQNDSVEVTMASYANYDIYAIEAEVISITVSHIEATQKQKAEEENAKAISNQRRQNALSAPQDGSRWDQLAQCECGGNWGCNTGNGFGGGLQFMHQRSYSTWLSFGGGEFAPHPWEASREHQIVIAERVLASSGWGAWPGCSRKFGWL